MKLWIISDLHTEFEPFVPPDPLPDADVAVIAGDFGIGGVVPAIRWLHANIAPSMDVVMVSGNHDFYETFYVEAIQKGRELAARLERVHFLENDSVAIGGTTFVGATLWTDFALLGSRELAMFDASTAMSDYRRIAYSKKPFQRFNPLRALREHQHSRRYLERAIAAARQPVVVVTHHAPSQRSVPDRYRGHRLSPAYASDLEDIIHHHRPVAWIHGHIHEAVDYELGTTRVVSDPLGYPSEKTSARAPVVIEV